MTEAAAVAQENPETPTPAVVDPNSVKFYFKKRTEVSKDATGKETKTEIPAPKPVSLVLPFLSVTDLVAILTKNDEKEVALVMESVNSQIIAQARDLVDEDPEKARTEGIDQSKLTWNFIANIPPAARRGGGIPDETWEAFIADYVDVMQHHGKSKEKAEAGAKLLAKRFYPVKDNKKVVKALLENLLVWFGNTTKGEELQQVYETLTSKANTLLEKDEDAVLAAI